MVNKEVARTIMGQLGNKTLKMLGAYQFVALKNGVKFRIRGSRKINLIKITLNPMDTYDIEFWRIRGTSFKKVSEVKGIYFDQLHQVIEQETGLYTSL